MKIKTRTCTYDEVMAIPRPEHRTPRKRSFLWHTLARIIIIPDMLATRFRAQPGKAALPDEPSLILMNHSSFLDLKIAIRLFYPKPFGIVATTDAMMGKESLMRWLGCIPTRKFVSDMTLIRDIRHMLRDKREHVLMYPEAGYSLDGRATTMPDNLGSLVKLLGVPVVTVITRGAFENQPLYNDLHIRRVHATAEMKCLFTREQVEAMSVEELTEALRREFSFDQFAYQYEHGIRVTEKNRADGLHRLLYKCPACGAEGHMEGKGEHLTCHACGKSWFMTELGRMEAVEGETEYPHIPDWFDWERDSVRRELEEGDYHVDLSVKVGMVIDTKALYMVGDGRLVHDEAGLHLYGADGRLYFEQKPLAAHTINVDFYWYEIGDIIGFGDRKSLYYCFPEEVDGVTFPVVKARLAAEEMYKIAKRETRR